MCSTKVDVFRFYVRQSMTKYIGIEYGYLEFDAMQWEIFSQSEHVLLQTKGFTIDAVGLLPVSSNLSFNGRIGGYYGDTDINIREGTSQFSESEAGVTARYGLGIEYRVGSFTLGAEYSVTEVSSGINESDAEYSGLTFAYQF
jgi:hypothetical protein